MEENKEQYNLPGSDSTNFKMEPPADAWEKLDAELTKRQAIMQKKAIRNRWIYGSLALLMVSSLTYFYLASPKQETVSIDNVATKSESPDAKEKQSSSTVTEEVKSPAVVSQNSEAKQETVSSSTEKSSVSQKQEAVNSPAPESEKRNANVLSSKKESVKAHVNSTPKIEIGNLLAKAEHKKRVVKSSVESNPSLVVAEQKRVKAPGSKKINRSENATAANSPVNANATEPAVVMSESKSPELAAQTHTEISSPDSTKQITASEPPKNPNYIKADSSTSTAKTDSTGSKQDVVKSHWSIAAYYTPNYSKNHLQSKSESGPKLISDYAQNEKSTYTFTAGLLAGYDLSHSSHWSIHTGIALSTISYSLTAKDLYAGYNSNNELGYSYYTSCGAVVVPNPNNTVVYKGDTVHTSGGELTIKLINVPLIIRYQITNKRFAGYIYAGGTANFVAQEKARLTIGGSEKSIINIDGLNNMNFGFLGGIGIQYNFNNGLGIFIEPAFRGSISSLTNNKYFDCFPYALGLNTGLSLHF